MKFKIDTEKKILTLVENTNIKELTKLLKALFPETWKEFSINTENTIVTWTNPVYTPPVPYFPGDRNWKDVFCGGTDIVLNTTACSVTSEFCIDTNSPEKE